MRATKICPGCHIEHELNNFPSAPSRGDKRGPYCKPCAAIRQGNYRKENAEKIAVTKAYYRQNNKLALRNRQLQRDYGITLEDYDRMYEQQNGVCAICQHPERHFNRGKLMLLVVDHCHKTGRVRGLLCHDCNTGLGKFKDNPQFLTNAQKYLENNLDTGTT